ncbi:hypothetical protein KSS87_012014 [Heliosperma pusillum]|nr:hypothetical protein KSS87_012014 [Heliosperma pusillum]
MSTINSANDYQERRSLQRREGGRCLTVLTREESVNGMECARGLECYSPARVAVCRLLTVVRKCKPRRRRDKVVAEEVEKREVSLDSTVVDHERIRDAASGHQRQEMSFNVVAGLGLLSLIAASKTELEKTSELRRQMETFLESAKQGHEGKVTPPNESSDPEITYAVSTTIDGPSNVSAYSQEGNGLGECSQEESGMSGVCDKHCDMYDTQRCVDEVSCLEEELAAELERLQIDIETEGYGETCQQLEHQEDVTEVSSNAKATGTATVSSSEEEVINPNDGVTPEHYGVPPLELERRLHELLEARQEERIRELEAHLEFVKGKLQEKEVEVIWWKDTAKLISKQVPQSSRAKVLRTGDHQIGDFYARSPE